MIKAESLTRNYRGIVAVQDVSFAIGHGEIVGLLGHNGAGKTTIMKMITGCLEPSSGSVSVDGHDVWSNRLAIQRQVGYLPENCPLYPEMTVVDYLDYAAALKRLAPADRPRLISDAIARTNLTSVAWQQVWTLSRGYKQRLGVAQAIINAPAILILDEPTNGLDPAQIVEMRSLIKELGRSATIVISTHILQEVQAVCDRVIIINAGRVALDSDLNRLRLTRRLELVTDLPPTECAQIVSTVDGLHLLRWEKKGSGVHYLLDSPVRELSETTPVLARALVHHGANVFALQPVVRDLEAVFAEITTGLSVCVQAHEANTSAEALWGAESTLSTSQPVLEAHGTFSEDDARQEGKVIDG